MISYRDITFCTESKCAKFTTCHRALTDQVIRDAQKWWGSEDAPIATNAEIWDCFEEELR